MDLIDWLNHKKEAPLKAAVQELVDQHYAEQMEESSDVASTSATVVGLAPVGVAPSSNVSLCGSEGGSVASAYPVTYLLGSNERPPPAVVAEPSDPNEGTVPELPGFLTYSNPFGFEKADKHSAPADFHKYILFPYKISYRDRMKMGMQLSVDGELKINLFRDHIGKHVLFL